MQTAAHVRRHIALLYFVTLSASAAVAVFASGPAASLSQPRRAARGPRGADAPSKLALANYGKLPLAFEINEGQTDARVKFLSRGAGYTLFLAGDEAVLALRGSRATRRGPGKTELRKPNLTGHEPPATNSILRMQLEGANLKARVNGADELPGKSNYFIGNDPKKWHTNVPTYAKVKYEGVYPGVDLVYYGNQGQLEYDFIVAPGANPGAIRLAVAAVSDRRTAMRTSPLQIASNGDLVVKISGGEVHFRKPVVYQPATGARQPRTAVDARYRLTHHQVTFEVGSYDKTRSLVIDPALAYSTYLGGSLGANGSAIAVDSSGDAYVTGSTTSTDFPVTPGAFQKNLHGQSNVFVTKLNPTGSALVYSTYLGGSAFDYGDGIAIDASGDAYITGQTFSKDFPVTPGAFQTQCDDCNPKNQVSGDAFVTELKSGGSALIYSSFLGGSGNEYAQDIAVDASGEAFVSGTTYSPDFPTTPGAFQTTCKSCGTGYYDAAFVTKFNATGSALVYSTYLGGSSYNGGGGLALDTLEDVYVTGFTFSSDFPTTSGAFQTSCSSCAEGYEDAFVTKLNPSGSALIYSTFLGGSAANVGSAVALDSEGDAYVTGIRPQRTFPSRRAHSNRRAAEAVAQMCLLRSSTLTRLRSYTRVTWAAAAATSHRARKALLWTAPGKST